MIGWASQWTQTPSSTSLQPIKWNAHFWITFPSDDLPGWLMNLNLICHPSPTKKMKCSLFDYVQLLMISQAGQLTQSPSASPLQPIKWNASFWIMFTSDDQPGWLMDSNPICHPSPANKMKCSFFDFVQLLMISQAGQWTQTPSASPLQPKNEMLLFGLRSTSDDRLGWSMDSNPILHLSPAKEMKCSFLYYVQLLMISWAGWWTRTPSTTPLQAKKWDAHFCITFNIWCWPEWSIDLNLIQHSSPSKNMKCSFLGYIQLLMISRAVRWTQTPSATPLQPIKWNASFWITFTSDDLPGWLMNLNLICHPSPTKKWNAQFLIMFNFWWLAGLVNGLKPHLPPLSRQKNEMLIFWLCSTSDDWPGWSMDSNPIHHSSPAKKNEMLIFGLRSLPMICLADWWTWTSSATPPTKKMKCSIFDYVQLLMISQAGQLTQTPSTTLLQPIKWNASFWIMFTSDDQPGWLMDSNPICHPSPANKMKCSLLDYVHFGWSARLVDGLKPYLLPVSSQ